MPRLSISLPEEVYRAMRDLASARGCSLNKVAVDWLEKSAQLDDDAYLIGLAKENAEKYGTDFIPVERLWAKKRHTKSAS